MKNLLIPISFLLLFTIHGNALNIKEVTVNSVKNTQILANPLIQHFDKGLKLISHKRGYKKIEHGADDYMRFNADKTYVQSYNGKITRGKWTYDKSTNEVTIILNTNVTKVYVVEESTATKVELKNDTERISLQP